VTITLKNQNIITLEIRNCPRSTTTPLQSALIQFQGLNRILVTGPNVACLSRAIATRLRRQKLPRPGAVLFPRLLRTPLPPTVHDVLARRRRRRRTVMLRPHGVALSHQQLTAGEGGRADVPHDPATGSHRRVGGGTHALRTQTAALSKKQVVRAVANMESEADGRCLHRTSRLGAGYCYQTSWGAPGSGTRKAPGGMSLMSVQFQVRVSTRSPAGPGTLGGH
jgi:hypothetical protein